MKPIYLAAFLLAACAARPNPADSAPRPPQPLSSLLPWRSLLPQRPMQPQPNSPATAGASPASAATPPTDCWRSTPTIA